MGYDDESDGKGVYRSGCHYIRARPAKGLVSDSKETTKASFSNVRKYIANEISDFIQIFWVRKWHANVVVTYTVLYHHTAIRGPSFLEN